MSNDMTFVVKVDLKALIAGKEDALNIVNSIPDKKDINLNLENKDGLIKDVGDIAFAFNNLVATARNIGAAFSSFINASNIQEKALAGLKSALAVTGENAQTAIKSYEKLATSIQKTTTIGDEQVLELARLATNMGIVNTKREEAIKGAIGLAQAYGIDLQTALKGVALAYEGEFSQLGRYIPALRSAQTETEKMAVLNEAMKNGFVMAQDATNTASGAMEQYKNLVGDLQEVIGEMIVTALLPCVKVLSEVVSFLTKYKVALVPVVVALGAFTVAMTKSLIVKGADLVATGALTIKTWALTVAIKAKTVALWLANVAVGAWNGLVGLTASLITAATYKLGFMNAALTVTVAKVALATAGISLLIGAIALLVSNVNSAGKEMSNGIEGTNNAINDVLVSGLSKLDQIDKEYAKKRLDVYADAEKEITNLEDGTLLVRFKNKEKVVEAENILYAQQQKDKARALKEDHDAEVAAAMRKIELGEVTYDSLLKIHQKYIDATKDQLKIWGNFESDAYNATIEEITLKQNETKENIAKNADEALKQQLDAHTKQINLTEKKIALGRDTYDTLKKQADDYVAFTKRAYGEESDAHLTALQKQQAIVTEMGKATENAYKDQLALLENTMNIEKRKVDIGEGSLDALKTAQNEYYDFVTANRNKDLNAYLRMMEQKKQADEDAIKRQQQQAEEHATRQQDMADASYDFHNKGIELKDADLARYNEQRRAVENYYEQNREILIQAGIDEVDIETQKNEAIQKLEQQYSQAKIDIVSGGLNIIASALEKSGKTGFEIAKAFRIADIIMTTPSAAMKSYDSLSAIPVIGPALGMAAFVSTIALGAMQIAEISKAKPPKAKKGGWQGLINGPSHDDGGLVIEIEGDEYITNKKRVRELGVPFFDFINFAPLENIKEWMAMTAKNAFMPSVPKFATGGLVNFQIPDIPTITFPNPASLIPNPSFSSRGIESRLDEMSDRLAYQLQQIENKNYEVNVRTKMKSLRLVKEIDKAYESVGRNRV